MRRVLRAAAVLLLVALAGVVPPRAAQAATAVTRSVTETRTHLIDGAEHQVDKRTVGLTVSNTTGLRGRQLIDVSWTGAHPTGGISPDPNWFNGRLSEYPMVLLECRGIDSDAVPANQRLDPTTCWTQTPGARYQSSGLQFPVWRLDRYETPDRRAATVGVPPNTCPGFRTQRMVPFVGADGTEYAAGSGCGAGAPEGTTSPDAAAPPDNNTFAPTGLDGTGHSRFEVWTSQENSSLGCGPTVPCALVAIPIIGLSCDPAAVGLPPEDVPVDDPDTPDVDEATQSGLDCEKTGQYAPGSRQPGQPNIEQTDLAVSGALWWNASNWRNRITVPLSFAQFADACDILDTRTPFDVYGSELLTQATAQWTADFCKNPKLFPVRHIKLGEPLAKIGLAGGDHFPAALVSRPPDTGWTKPTVTAPVGISGFAISFAIDDGNGNEVTRLQLNPRLIAKLLSESYLALPALRDDMATAVLPKALLPYRAMAGNPLTITVDPEFIALNPDIGQNSAVVGGATLLALSGNSDVIYALTQYLQEDPEARAFLNGKPDPWGMIVNPGYRGITLPAESWPIWDNYLPSLKVAGSEAFRYCLSNDKGQVTPIPLLPLVAAPVTSLATIAQKQEYALLNASQQCVTVQRPDGSIASGSFKPMGKQAPGSRFMLALTAFADGPRYGLRAAALQSTSTVTNVSAKFSDAHGRTFVTPSDTSMKAALALTTSDEVTHTWPIPYQKLRTGQGKNAYPGTMVVYAAVPTSGLSHTDASEASRFLEFAATTGQIVGTEAGRLPPGYLPMTPANGLGAMVLYTRRAAALVAQQSGTVPDIVEHAIPVQPLPPVSPTPGAQKTPDGGLPPVAADAVPGPYKPGVQVPVGYTGALASTLAGFALPIVAAICLLSLLLAVVIRTRVGALAMTRLQNRINRRIRSRGTS